MAVNFLRIKNQGSGCSNMATELKIRRQLVEENCSSLPSQPIEQEFIGYTFLRNIWGTYFHDRHQAPCEDKLDSINKIVGMMKAQVRLMIVNQTKQSGPLPLERDTQYYLLFHKMQCELQQTKQSLQRSYMKQEEYLSLLCRQQEKILAAQSENQRLTGQVFLLKEAKNKVTEKVIELSKKVYDLQRFNPAVGSEASFFQEYSAITVDRQVQNQPKQKFSLFRRDSQISVFNMCEDTKSIHSSQQNEPFLQDDLLPITNENKPLNELNLNLNLNLKPQRPKMKQSLQCYLQTDDARYNQFMLQMKKVKLQTQRIMGANNQISNRSKKNVRRTMEPLTDRPVANLEKISSGKKEKRFKRIR